MEKTHLLNGLAILCTLVAAFSTLETQAFARPEWQLAENFPNLLSSRRKNLVVIANAGTTENPRFKLFRPSIVPLTKTNQIKWFSDSLWIQDSLSPRDQIIIEDWQFGPPANRPLKLAGCTPEGGVPVRSQVNPGSKVAFLASCDDRVVSTLGRIESPVGYNLGDATIESKYFAYRYKTKNHMLFDSVEIKSKSGQNIQLAKDADLMIRADVKRFFNMQFNSTDLESKMKASRSDVLGAFATVGFYLKILFFKISMDLDTDVRFFSKSSHIPMVLTTPVDASKRLNDKSGVLYSFELGNGVQPSDDLNVPILSDRAIPFEDGLKHCTAELCTFKLSFVTSDPSQPFKMELIIPKQLVHLGFFPQFVKNVSESATYMKWSLTKEQESRSRVGIYLEVSKLPEGEHPWDFWMDFAQ